MIKWIATRRFNLIDATACIMIFDAARLSQYLLAIVIAVLALVVSVAAELHAYKD